MLSPRQVRDVMIASLAFSLLAVACSPPAAGAFMVFAAAFTLSTMALSAVVALQNLLGNPARTAAPGFSPDVHVVHTPRQRVGIAPRVIHHHQPQVVVRHQTRMPTAHVVPSAVVHRAQPVATTAAGTVLPENASHVRRTTITTPVAPISHAQGASLSSRAIIRGRTPAAPARAMPQGSTGVTAAGTRLPANATHVQRTVTPATPPRTSSMATSTLSNRAVIRNETPVRPTQSSGRTLLFGAPMNAQQSSRMNTTTARAPQSQLSGRVIVRKR